VVTQVPLTSAVTAISHSKPLGPNWAAYNLEAGWRDYRIVGTDRPTIDDCKRISEQCLRWADEAANNEQRDTLLEIAGLWMQMELSSADPNKMVGVFQAQGFQGRQNPSPGPLQP
jgi:hypothetical protein